MTILRARWIRGALLQLRSPISSTSNNAISYGLIPERYAIPGSIFWLRSSLSSQDNMVNREMLLRFAFNKAVCGDLNALLGEVNSPFTSPSCILEGNLVHKGRDLCPRFLLPRMPFLRSWNKTFWNCEFRWAKVNSYPEPLLLFFRRFWINGVLRLVPEQLQ